MSQSRIGNALREVYEEKRSGGAREVRQRLGMQKRRETQVQMTLTWGRGWRALALGQLGPWHRLQAPGLKSFKSLLKRFLRHQMALKNQYFDDLSARESETYGSNCPQIIHTLKNVLVFSGLQIFEKQTGTLSSSPDRGHLDESAEEVHGSWQAPVGRGMVTPLGSLLHRWDSKEQLHTRAPK